MSVVYIAIRPEELIKALAKHVESPEVSEDMQKLLKKVFCVGVKLTKLISQISVVADKDYRCPKEVKAKVKADLDEAQKDNV